MWQQPQANRVGLAHVRGILRPFPASIYPDVRSSVWHFVWDPIPRQQLEWLTGMGLGRLDPPIPRTRQPLQEYEVGSPVLVSRERSTRQDEGAYLLMPIGNGGQ